MQRYHPSDNETPYHCKFCSKACSTRFAAKRHFKDLCLPKHPEQKDAKWDDHPSCLTAEQALEQKLGRPFYPDYYTVQPDGNKHMCWPTRSDWPRDEVEMLRQNEEYRQRPGVNPWYVAINEHREGNSYRERPWKDEEPRLPHGSFSSFEDSDLSDGGSHEAFEPPHSGGSRLGTTTAAGGEAVAGFDDLMAVINLVVRESLAAGGVSKGEAIQALQMACRALKGNGRSEEAGGG